MQLYTLKSQVEKSIDKAKDLKKTIGLVPTMGSLHQGHLSLLKKAVQSCEVVWVTIFVNPTQFGKNEDFDKYPRTLPEDIARLEELSVTPDVIFTPQVSEVYADGIPERLEPRAGAIGSVFEGAARPGHFDGMLHIVSWFFRNAILSGKCSKLVFVQHLVCNQFS